MTTKKDINLADYIVDPPPHTKHPGGRPPKDPADKVVKCRISMTQAHHAATEGDRAGMIRRALDMYLSENILERVFPSIPENPNATATTITITPEAAQHYLNAREGNITAP